MQQLDPMVRVVRKEQLEVETKGLGVRHWGWDPENF